MIKIVFLKFFIEFNSNEISCSINHVMKVGVNLPQGVNRIGIEMLFKRVEKHFQTEAQESYDLFPLVWVSVKNGYLSTSDSFAHLIELCFPGAVDEQKLSLGKDEISWIFEDLSRR